MDGKEVVLMLFMCLSLISLQSSCSSSKSILADNAKSSNTPTKALNPSSGNGTYDDSGKGVNGRMVTHRDKSIVFAMNVSGTIVMKVCINPAGDVTFVELIDEPTTIKNPEVLQNVMRAMWNYKYEPDSKAPIEECGKFKVTADNR